MIPALLVAALLGPASTSPSQEVPPRQEQGGEGTVGAAPAAAEPAPRGPVPVLLNSVQLIVNDHCITIGDLQRMAAQQGKPATSRQEYVRMLEEGADQLARKKLMEQAGRDLGYDEAMVRSYVRNELNRTKEAFGSVSALAQQLDRASYDSIQLKEDTEDRIYRDLWQGAVTGKFQGPGGRPFVDRYVRPGQIKLEFERQGSSLDLPTRVQLEEIIIAPALGESPESARQKAQLVRSRLERGEDLYELNATFGIAGRDPRLDPIEEEGLAVFPEIAAFVEAAQPGEISEVIPILRTGQVSGFRILRFVGRQSGQAASFVDRQFQTQLSETVRARRDRSNTERALQRLMEGAYVWPPEMVSPIQPGPPGAQAPQAGDGQAPQEAPAPAAPEEAGAGAGS